MYEQRQHTKDRALSPNLLNLSDLRIYNCGFSATFRGANRSKRGAFASELGQSPSWKLNCQKHLIESFCCPAFMHSGLFTVVNAVLLRPMNYPHPEEIVEITEAGPASSMHPRLLRRKLISGAPRTIFSRRSLLITISLWESNLTGRGEPERLASLPVTADFFRVLGDHPQSEGLLAKLKTSRAPGVFVVLSYDRWKRLFHGRPIRWCSLP
jgi:hypothetical protein